jgi:hypothetical protein
MDKKLTEAQKRKIEESYRLLREAGVQVWAVMEEGEQPADWQAEQKRIERIIANTDRTLLAAKETRLRAHSLDTTKSA